MEYNLILWPGEPYVIICTWNTRHQCLQDAPLLHVPLEIKPLPDRNPLNLSCMLNLLTLDHDIVIYKVNA